MLSFSPRLLDAAVFMIMARNQSYLAKTGHDHETSGLWALGARGARERLKYGIPNGPDRPLGASGLPDSVAEEPGEARAVRLSSRAQRRRDGRAACRTRRRGQA